MQYIITPIVLFFFCWIQAGLYLLQMLTELPNLFWTVWFSVPYILKRHAVFVCSNLTHLLHHSAKIFIKFLCLGSMSVLICSCCSRIQTSTAVLKPADMLTTAPAQMKIIKKCSMSQRGMRQRQRDPLVV